MNKFISLLLLPCLWLISGIQTEAGEAGPLHIYCGAGMTRPFTEISQAFTKETHIPAEVTYANAGQIQAQINAAREGDFFIAGAAEELKPVAQYVTASRELVKHIPVLAVQKGNPRHIQGLADLGRKDVRVVLGDPKATPIGKIADRALADAGLTGKVNILSRGITAPSIFNALSVGECDAVIVWKENVSKAMDIVADPLMDRYVKTIPAATLSFPGNTEGRKRFLDFLGSQAARQIWEKFGYVVLN